MDEFARRIYFREIALQAQLALSAGAQVVSVVKALDNGADFPADYLHAEVFRNLHSLLTHASNISRLLWPPRLLQRKGEDAAAFQARCTLACDRGQLLRDTLGIPESGHPLKDHDLRDHLEHFDERLDAWQSRAPKRCFMDWNIGPPNLVAGIDDRDRLRGFDPHAATFYFRGEKFDVHALITGIHAILPRAAAEAQQVTSQ